MRILLALILVVLLSPFTAQAVPITYEYSGVVTNLSPGDSCCPQYLFSTIQVGTPLTGRLEFDTQLDHPEFSNPLALLVVGPYTFFPQAFEGLAHLLSDGSLHVRFQSTHIQGSGFAPAPFDGSDFVVDFTGFEGYPQWTGISGRTYLLGYVGSSDGLFSSGTSSFFLEGRLDSLTVVPEPASLMLFATALGVLPWVRRSKATR
jgi:hypothetical protein